MDKLLHQLSMRAAVAASETPPQSTQQQTTDADTDLYSINLSYDETEWCDRNSYTTIGVFNALFTMFGIMTGILLIIIIWKNTTLKENKYTFLNNFFGSSFGLLILIGILYTKEALHPCWHVGSFMCKVIHLVKTILTNNTTNFLIVMAIEQMLRYGEVDVNVFNSIPVRGKNLVVGVVWAISAIMSIPEIFLARILKLDFEGVISICDVFHFHGHKRFVFAAKIIFVEYIVPFVVLSILVTVIGVYIMAANSRYSSWGTSSTSGRRRLPQDFSHPKYFLLVAILSLTFVLGYFPRYSFELATFLDDLISSKEVRAFWWELDTISTLFAIIPPAMTPLCIMLLSWQHRNVILTIYQSFTVDTSEWQQHDAAAEPQPTAVSLDAENVKQSERYEQMA